MNVITKVKLKLAKMLDISLAEVSTDKGTLYYDGELGLETEVFFIDEDGNYILPPDGEYMEGDRTLTIENGVITKIDDKEQIQKETDVIHVPSPENGEDVSPEKFNDLLEAFEDLAEKVGATFVELKKQVKENDKKIDSLELELSKATRKSNKEFEDNKPKLVNNKESEKDILNKFGIKK